MSYQSRTFIHKLVALLVCATIVSVSLPSAPTWSQEPSTQEDNGSTGQSPESPNPNYSYMPYLSSSPTREGVQITAAKPNIVFIITDDQPYHMQQFLPETNRLIGDQGIVFKRAFAEDPLCCPSRTSIFTGQYARRHNNIDNEAPYGGAEIWHERGGDQSTIATWLQDAGYRTGLFGKYMNDVRDMGPIVPPGWNEWYAFINGDITIDGVKQVDGIDGEGYLNYVLSENGNFLTFLDTPAEYGTDVITQRTLEFIRESPASQPLFVYYAPRAPHLPAIPAPRDVGTLDSISRYRPPNYNEADVSDKPPWIRNRSRMTSEQMDKVDKLYVDMAESLQAVDRGTAAIVRELERTGRLNNTILIFTSDHGFALGEHRHHSWKECIYEECIHVPLMVRAPGVSPRIDFHLISLADIAPTLAELAGVTPPIPVDGVSFVPLLYSAKVPWRDILLIESLGLSPNKNRNLQGVRTSDYVYAELESGFAELYDMHNDPYQLTNLADDPAYAATVNDLKGRLYAFKFSTNLSLTQTASATSTTTGSDVRYTIMITNNGSRAAHSVAIQDLLPPQLSFVSCTASDGGVCQGKDNNRKIQYLYLGVGETRTVTLVGKVRANVDSGVVIRNSASVSAMTSTDPAPGNNSATTSVTVENRTAEVIFANGFETGDLSAWSNATVDGGDLRARTRAAMVQEWGLHALVDDNRAISVHDERPAGERRYQVRFYFDPNGMTMAEGDSHILLFGYSGTGTKRPVLRIAIRLASGKYQVQAALVNDNATWRGSSWVKIANMPHYLEVEWRAATAAGSNDGALNFWVDGVQRARMTGVDNDTRRIDRIRLGAVAGIDSGTRGAYFFDAFESRRSGYIGAATDVPAIAIVADDQSIDATELTAYTETNEADPAEAALLQEVLQEATGEEGSQEHSSYELHLPHIMP